MTSSYSSTGQNDQNAALTASTSTKPLPKYFSPNPVAFEITNNEFSSAPYYFDYDRNSWIFYKPGTDIPNPPLDPDAGNLWIDPTRMYLMYVYNVNELTFPDAGEEQWYALTTNKRAYDYMIVPISNDGTDISTYRNREAGIDIFKQGYMYFNLNEADLKVKVNINDGGDTAWVSMTQRGIEPVSGDNPDDLWNSVLPHSQLRQLEGATNSLQKRTEDLAAKLNYPMAISDPTGVIDPALAGTGTNTYPSPTNVYVTQDTTNSSSTGY